MSILTSYYRYDFRSYYEVHIFNSNLTMARNHNNFFYGWTNLCSPEALLPTNGLLPCKVQKQVRSKTSELLIIELPRPQEGLFFLAFQYRIELWLHQYELLLPKV